MMNRLCPMLSSLYRSHSFITDHRTHSTIHRRPSGTEPVRLLLLVSGAVYPSTSLLHLRCLSSGHASRLISSPFPVPVRDHVQCLHSDTCHFGLFNRSCYLLTYLLFTSTPIQSVTSYIQLSIDGWVVCGVVVRASDSVIERWREYGEVITPRDQHAPEEPLRDFHRSYSSHATVAACRPSVGQNETPA